MNPKLSPKRILPKRSTGTRRVSLGSEHEMSFSRKSVRDEAVLLLSIAHIVESEIKSESIDIFSDDTSLPRLPLLTPDSFHHGTLLPKTEAPQDVFAHPPRHMTDLYPSSRVRSVSMDSTTGGRSVSPLLALVSPSSSPRSSHKRKEVPSTRVPSRRISAKKARHEETESLEGSKQGNDRSNSSRSVHFEDERSGKLQGCPPKGVAITKIKRRKYSWKNYPELEQFLVANREEYLRHSALNYTIEQKQYNNRLTDRLLELATEHGYLFDESEFSFVTVRDRIRCYYKSYVQSAKKRGILMGYAARKAGLLSESELTKSSGKAARILEA